MFTIEERGEIGMKLVDKLIEVKLPKDIYDALELAVLANGGNIGGHVWWKDIDGEICPVCIEGYAQFLDGTLGKRCQIYRPFDGPMLEYADAGEVETTLRNVVEAAYPKDIFTPNEINDTVVKWRPVSWKVFIKRAKFVRGEE